MIQYYVRGDDSVYRTISAPPKEGGLVYGHMVNEAEIRTLAQRYDLDLNTMRDVLDHNELPRVELKDHTLYVFLRTVRKISHGRVHSVPVLLALNKSTLFVLSTSSDVEYDWPSSQLLRQAQGLPAQMIAALATIMAEYEILIRKIGRYIADTGGRLRTHEVKNKDFIRFATLEENLNEYHTNLTAMRAVAKRLQTLKLSGHDVAALEDIILYIDQLVVATESHMQSITSIRNAYSTIANNTLNQTMKILTAITLLIALPNLFFSMYGMNVTLPFQDQPWAYPAIGVISVVLVLLVIVVARRFKVF